MGDARSAIDHVTGLDGVIGDRALSAENDTPALAREARPDEAERADFLLVLREAVSALASAGVPHVLAGGIASRGLGRPRATRDIDVLVKPEDASWAVEALGAAGFRTEKTDPRWLYKGFKRDRLVDIIFSSSGGVYLDDEMLAHALVRDYEGVRVRLIAPEDLVVMKAMADAEDRSRHWHDALGLIAGRDLDWSYLERRAMRAPRRLLSLFLYAHSLDMYVPNRVIKNLYERLFAS